MRLKITIIVLLCGFFLALPARGEELQQALSDAYRMNPALAAKRAELRAIDEGLALALSGYRPSIGFDADLGAATTHRDGAAGGSESLNPRGAGITITQPLFRGFRTSAAVERAGHDIDAGIADLISTEQNILASAVEAYMDVLRDRAVLELTRNNQLVLQRQLDAIQDRFSIGEVTRTDIALGESRLERAKAAAISASGQLAASESRFFRIIGRAPDASLQTPPPWANLPESRDAAIELARQNNPSVLAAKAREKSAETQIGEIRGEELPEINLEGSASSDWNRSTDGDKVEEASLMARLNFPFYQGGGVMARTRAAKQTASQRRLEGDNVLRLATETASRAFDDLQTARANIGALQSTVLASEIALQGVREEQNVGSRTVIDVLDAEQELLDAQVGLVRARRDEVVSSYALLAAIGRLTAQAIALPVPVYDPSVHRNEIKGRWIGY